jgi:hypothetical protein
LPKKTDLINQKMIANLVLKETVTTHWRFFWVSGFLKWSNNYKTKDQAIDAIKNLGFGGYKYGGEVVWF